MTTAVFISATLPSFLMTALLAPAVIRLARRFNCYDHPGRRRFHSIKTPRWGGVAFFLGLAPVLLAVLGPERRLLALLTASVLLVVAGMIDDRRSIGWKSKMVLTVLAAATVVFGGGIALRQLGTFGGSGPVELGMLGVPFTIFCIVGVTNAVNMIDGLNGLSTGIAIIAFVLLGAAAASAGNAAVVIICFGFAGSLLGFLGFNFPRARIFMGDSGSMFLGFSLAVVAILLTQDARYPVEPFYPVAVLFLPIADAVRLMIVRASRGKSPFLADKGHLHHLLIRNGISSVSTVVILWTVAAAAGAGAFIMRDSGLGLAALIVVLAVSMGFAARTLVERKGSRRSGRTECLPEPVAVALLPVLVYPSRQDTRGTVHPIRQHGAIEAPPPVAMAGTSRARDARHPFRAGTGVADQ